MKIMPWLALDALSLTSVSDLIGMRLYDMHTNQIQIVIDVQDKRKPRSVLLLIHVRIVTDMDHKEKNLEDLVILLLPLQCSPCHVHESLMIRNTKGIISSRTHSVGER